MSCSGLGACWASALVRAVVARVVAARRTMRRAAGCLRIMFPIDRVGCCCGARSMLSLGRRAPMVASPTAGVCTFTAWLGGGLATMPGDGDRMLSLARLTIRRAREERLAQVAGSLTFSTVLSIVPLLAVSFALFTRFPVFRRFET